MTRTEAENLLRRAMTIGEMLLVCGAEVNRVEDTVRRICTAYGGVSRVDVFTITSSIVTTISGPDFGSHTETLRVRGMSYDLRRLDALNRLSRRICSDKLSTDDIDREVAKIRELSKYPLWAQLLFYALISGAFSIFFGGNLGDMAASSIIGVLLKLLESVLNKNSENSLVTALICSTIGGFLAHLAVAAGVGSHPDLISIGNIMLLIPGIAFTNSLRDLFSGDTITGIVRFLESALLAVVIALGFTFAGFCF